MAIYFNQKLRQSGTGIGRRSLRSAKRAFTLVELLIATGITIVIAGMMVAVTTQVLNAWTRSSDTLEMNQTARIVLDFLASDLQSAAFRNDGNDESNVWMRATFRENESIDVPEVSRTTLPPANLPTSETDLNFRMRDALFGEGIYLRFFASTLDRMPGEVGGLNALGYQVIRRSVTSVSSPPPDSFRYILHRNRILDRDVFDAGYNLGNDEYPAPGNDEYPAPGNKLRNPSLRSMLGLNVFDLGVVFYDRQGRILFPLPGNISTGYSAPTDGRAPAFADVSVRILTGEGADILNLVETGRLGALPDGMTIQDFLNTYSQVFTRRVQILAQPL